MTGGSASYSTSRRSQLQRELGDVGTVLDRVSRGGGQYSAAGWYARIGDPPSNGERDERELVYLGDHANVAIVTISKLLEPDE